MVRYSTYISLFISFLFLPLILFIASYVSFPALLLFYTVNGALILTSFLRYTRRLHQRSLACEELQGKINIVKDENTRERSFRIALQERVRRYQSLKKIIEEVGESLSLEFIAEHLAVTVFSAISRHKGVCNLYLVDAPTQKLSLFKTIKEDAALVIKAKEGDLFDQWVLRHARPLLVEDSKNDFRFDVERAFLQDARPVGSLISSPLVSGHTFLGLLRLDTLKTHFFTQDDLRFLTAICDIGAVALENGELFLRTQDLAIHDELTSLFRKGYFLERLREECKRTARQNAGFSLLMIDIDFFKKYNDAFGHIAGDLALKEVSRAIVESFRSPGVIAGRFGGEEFCVILPGTDKMTARESCEVFRKKIEETTITLRKQATSVTVSIGIAAFPADGRDESELILKADKAMYEAKQKGRNRVVVC